MAENNSIIFLRQLNLIILILFSSLVAYSCGSTTTTNTPPPFKRVYAFGDSYTDTGNTRTSTGPSAFNYVSNPPYGVTFFHRPTNRYSDGRIVLDFVAQALSLPSLLPPYRDPRADRSHGINFAVAGATATRTGFFLKNNVSFNIIGQSLQNQLVWFNKIMGEKGCKDLKTTPGECRAALGEDALIWLGEIGANDYTCSVGSSISSKTVRDHAINSVAGFMQALINKGAKYIVVQGLPPTGCVTYSFALASPDDRDEMGCVGSVNRVTYAHNAALQARLAVVRKQNPHTIIAYADYYNAHLAVLKNAAKYGFKERYKACCGHGGGEYNFDVFNVCGTPSSRACANPSEYINWDGAHFTEAVNKVLTNSFLNGSYCSPRFDYILRKKLISG